MKKVAIFDIDGTIFRSSLLIELTKALVDSGIFPTQAKNIYEKPYKRWLERKGTYEKYIGAVIKAYGQYIKDIKHVEFLEIAAEVVSLHQNRVYRFTRDLVKELRKKKYYILAISNSPREIVEKFCQNLGFNKVYGWIYETDKKDRFTGKILYADLVINKEKILKRAISKENLTLKGSVGVGDTESDIPFLKMVEKPICFNPNKKLYDYAKRAGWKIVDERKDVIYKL